MLKFYLPTLLCFLGLLFQNKLIVSRCMDYPLIRQEFPNIQYIHTTQLGDILYCRPSISLYFNLWLIVHYQYIQLFWKYTGKSLVLSWLLNWWLNCGLILNTSIQLIWRFFSYVVYWCLYFLSIASISHFSQNMFLILHVVFVPCGKFSRVNLWICT